MTPQILILKEGEAMLEMSICLCEYHSILLSQGSYVLQGRLSKNFVNGATAYKSVNKEWKKLELWTTIRELFVSVSVVIVYYAW